jgi:hypothetical protein
MAFSVLSLRSLVTPVGGVGSREAAVKPTWMYSRRLDEQVVMVIRQ